MNVKFTDNTLTEHTISFEKLLSQSDFTILYFYPKDNTPGCTIEAQDFSSLTQSFQGLHTQVIGVSKDSHKSHCNFITKYGLEIGLIVDDNLDLHNQYNVIGEKKMYGKIYKGTIRSTFLLDKSAKILKERRNINEKGHAEEVMKYLKNLNN